MSTCFKGLCTAPVFHFAITTSKFGITEMDLFFSEPPDRARSFGTLRWIYTYVKVERADKVRKAGDEARDGVPRSSQ